MTIPTRKLVLFIEEHYYNFTKKDDTIDSTCYVVYDDMEKEYFVCGSRVSDEHNKMFGEYHFYCKSRSVLLNFLSFVFKTGESNINYGIYNYTNIFDKTERVDYQFLNEHREYENEIALYEEMPYRRSKMNDLLKMIKYVRY